MKHATLVFTLVLVCAAGALDIELTQIGETPFEEHDGPIVLHDVDGDGAQEWFYMVRTSNASDDEVRIMGYNLVCSNLFDQIFTIPRSVPAEDRRSIVFNLLGSGAEAKLLLAYGDEDWVDDTFTAHVLLFSYPEVTLLDEALYMHGMTQTATNENTQYVLGLESADYDGFPTVFLMLEDYDRDIGDESGSTTLNTFMQTWVIQSDTLLDAGQIDEGGFVMCKIDLASGALFTIDRTTYTYFGTNGSGITKTHTLYRKDETATLDLLTTTGSNYSTHSCYNYPIGIAVIRFPVSHPVIPAAGFIVTATTGDYIYFLSCEYFASNPYGTILWQASTAANVSMLQAGSLVTLPGMEPLILCWSSEPDYNQGISVLDAGTGETLQSSAVSQGQILDVLYDDTDWYMLIADDSPGFCIYKIDSITLDADENATPASQANLSAYPNPFNPETTIAFSLAEPAHSTLCVYNIRGQRVATLLDEPLPAGEHTVTWAATGCSSGIYFAKLTTPEGVRMTKLLLLQ
ncbi:MAG: T9SS type A sorting domain-containing protein [Candidatus Cloacimonetes bacterium]|nr:T9SS type A sorting domain-containing protein [Candidatus Cloacimonadota bacterium]